MENPIQVNDLGAPPISGHLHMGHISRVYKSTQEQLAKKRKTGSIRFDRLVHLLSAGAVEPRLPASAIPSEDKEFSDSFWNFCFG